MRLYARIASREMAIRATNGPAMDDRLHKLIYGREILRDERRPLMWLLAVEAKDKRHPNRGRLMPPVKVANDCCEVSADKTMKRAVDLGLISCEREGNQAIYFLSDDQWGKLIRLQAMQAVIPKVVEAQAAKPNDATAGFEILAQAFVDLQEEDPQGSAEKVHWNIIGQFERAALGA